MKHIQNNQKSIGNLKKLKKKVCKPKVLRLLPNVCDFQTENHTPGYGIYRKSIPGKWIFIL
jgi:hypothetical protein